MPRKWGRNWFFFLSRTVELCFYYKHLSKEHALWYLNFLLYKWFLGKLFTVKIFKIYKQISVLQINILLPVTTNKSSQVKSTFFSDIRIYIHKKNTIFNNRNKHRNKNNCSSSNQNNELRYFLMSEGNTCVAEPKLEVLPYIWFSKGLV